MEVTKCKNCGHHKLWHPYFSMDDEEGFPCHYFRCECPNFEAAVEVPLPGIHFTADTLSLDDFNPGKPQQEAK